MAPARRQDACPSPPSPTRCSSAAASRSSLRSPAASGPCARLGACVAALVAARGVCAIAEQKIGGQTGDVAGAAADPRRACLLPRSCDGIAEIPLAPWIQPWLDPLPLAELSQSEFHRLNQRPPHGTNRDANASASASFRPKTGCASVARARKTRSPRPGAPRMKRSARAIMEACRIADSAPAEAGAGRA